MVSHHSFLPEWAKKLLTLLPTYFYKLRITLLLWQLQQQRWRRCLTVLIAVVALYYCGRQHYVLILWLSVRSVVLLLSTRRSTVVVAGVSFRCTTAASTTMYCHYGYYFVLFILLVPKTLCTILMAVISICLYNWCQKVMYNHHSYHCCMVRNCKFPDFEFSKRFMCECRVRSTWSSQAPVASTCCCTWMQPQMIAC
jgi:hypothetical protein